MNVVLHKIKCEYGELRHRILPLIVNTVFHVTNKVAFDGIIRDGSIRNNQNNDFYYSFGQSENSYGRKRGYICLFDLRDKSDEVIDEALMRYNFLHPFYSEKKTYFFQISAAIYPSLIDTSEAKKEIGCSEMWIPNVECWYPSDLSIDYIEKVTQVQVNNIL